MRLNKKPFLIFKIALRYLILQIRGGWVLPKISKKQKSVRLFFRKSCIRVPLYHACKSEKVILKIIVFAYCKHGKRISFYEFYKRTPPLKDDVLLYFWGKPQSPFLKKIISKIATKIFFHQYFLTTIIDFYFVH